jgi:hypothetical protein
MLKIGWKSWTLIFLGGVTALMAYTLVSQWKHASLGRQISRNVTKFLIDHGSHVEGDVISGGMVSVPLKMHAAVNATVLQMLAGLEQQISAAQPARPPQEQGQAAELEGLGDPVYSPQRSRSAPMSSPQGKRQASSSSSVPATLHSATARRSSSRGAPASPQRCTPPQDDGGFTSSERKLEDYEFNPNEFGGKKTPQASVEDMLKDDDGFQ